MTSSSKKISLAYLRQTIELARQSPPKPSNFRVGCVIVSFTDPTQPETLSTGYTLELEGNTHAEQCALSKLAQHHSLSEDLVGQTLSSSANTTLYTSLEPCGKRLSGNLPCVQRIVGTRQADPSGGIRRVVFGAKEPGTFVNNSQSCKLLTEAGIEWEYLPDFEQEILEVAMEGHKKEAQQDHSDDQVSYAEKEQKEPPQAQEIPSSAQDAANEVSQPRNPKKRMMEAPPGSEESWR